MVSAFIGEDENSQLFGNNEKTNEQYNLIKLTSLEIEYQQPSQDEVEKSMSKIINTYNVKKVYEFQKILGSGSFGIVHKAID